MSFGDLCFVQFGSKICGSDISQFSRIAIGTFENDTNIFFDHIMMSFDLVSFMIRGTPKSCTRMWESALQHMHQYVKETYSITKGYYKYTKRQ